MWSGSWRRWERSTRAMPTTSCTRTATTSPPPCLRFCVGERSRDGWIAWPTSVPACHFSRAACLKSGWPPRPCSPAWARSCTGRDTWRRVRMPPPPPPWPPCRPAHPPAQAPHVCLHILAITSRVGRIRGRTHCFGPAVNGRSREQTAANLCDVNAVSKQSTRNVSWKEQWKRCCWQMLDIYYSSLTSFPFV